MNMNFEIERLPISSTLRRDTGQYVIEGTCIGVGITGKGETFESALASYESLARSFVRILAKTNYA